MTIQFKKTLIDRRDLIRLTSVGAAGLYLSDVDALASGGVCEDPTKIDLAHGPTVEDAGDQLINVAGRAEERSLYYFIDGCYTNHWLLPSPSNITDKASIGLIAHTGERFKIFRSISGPSTSNGGNTYPFPEMTEEERESFRILTKAKVAIHIEFPQTQEDFIETVMLSDASNRVIGMRKFSPANAIDNGSQKIAPYVIFDRLNLVEGQPLHISYVRRKINEPSIVYQYTIPAEHVRPSRFDFQHLPSQAFSEGNGVSLAFALDLTGGPQSNNNPNFKGQHAVTYANGSIPDGDIRSDSSPAMPPFPFNAFGGLVSNAYYLQRAAEGANGHSVRAHFEHIDSAGNFRVRIAKMHGDRSQAHYMRYFMVLDPVGRIIGGLKRTYEGMTYDTELGNAHGASSFLVKQNFVEGVSDQELYKLTKIKITEMPYVQVITEDVLDAMARLTFRLR